jgi:2-amino-4-hydroxy-6-hydroxymethyldihydropteridine diphosphokinase/dihydroneopterin aldolase
MDNLFLLRPPEQLGEICIGNLICNCLCGVQAKEHLASQPLAIGGRLIYPIEQCTSTEAIADAIDYDTLCAQICGFLADREFFLLETAARDLCRDILTKFPTALRCHISVRKLTTAAALAAMRLTIRATVRKSIVLLGMGSNLGDRKSNLAGAREAIGQIPFSRILGQSSIHRTAPLLVEEQPDFFNQTLRVETLLPPMELLRHTLGIEKKFGRRRDLPKGPRTLDIDILLFEGVNCASAELTLPHPGIHLRRFWIEEMMELGVHIFAANPSVMQQTCETISNEGTIG